MSKEKSFFKKLRKHVGISGHSERFIQELKDHVEDKKREEMSMSEPLASVGKPEELAKLYKKAVFPEKARRYFAIVIFLFSLICSEAMALYFDVSTVFIVEILTMIGLFLYMFALPVIVVTILLSEVSVRLWGENIVVFWPIKLILLPFLVAVFHTFIYLVFACDPSLWDFRKDKFKPIED